MQMPSYVVWLVPFDGEVFIGAAIALYDNRALKNRIAVLARELSRSAFPAVESSSSPFLE